uniref:Helicase ATP-binding domain-containing protein n=1 Tax=Megaviridae environmental sample TaxID=1737588 RepID=A0A5J6VN86_9VIRU|nr:MAG: hypothetical protein [Megaviridae environmental sample]
MEAIIDKLKHIPERLDIEVDLIDKTDQEFDFDYGILNSLVKPEKEKTTKLKENVFKNLSPDIDTPTIDEFADIIEWKKHFLKTDIHLRTPDYYLHNREYFTKFINQLLSKYHKQLTKSPQENEDYFIHQKLLQKYLNVYSPYRGLLLYHGLGTGKTCSSIGIAEGFKKTNKIVILTPASLQKNYLKELKVCGDPLFKFNQFWYFKSLDKFPDLIKIADYINVTEECIRKNNGVWFADVNKEDSNYDILNNQQQKSLDFQITTMIKSRYVFINYNGLRLSKWKEYITKNDNNNLFNNKIVIIDEAHNFVSRIVNKLNNPNTLSMQMYHDLMDAENCRIVLLTGTPIINYPNEISVLFNLLRGYIKSFTLSLTYSKPLTLQKIIDILKTDKKTKLLFDYTEYKSASNTLLLTKNPFGFVNRFHSKKYKGIRRDDKKQLYDTIFYNDKNNSIDFLKQVKQVLQKNKIMVNGLKKNTYYKCLPDSLEDFNHLFIDNAFSIKNELMLKRRILGLTSFFENVDKKLMPSFDKEQDIVIQHIKMSKHQFNQYNIIRAEERKQELNSKKNKHKKKNDLYEDTSSTYRIFSRAACNFVFPDKFPRPKPNSKKALNEQQFDNLSTIEQINQSPELMIDDTDKVEEEAKALSSYPEMLEKALTFLKENAQEYLIPSNDGSEKSGLNIYSPKFLQVLKNIQNADYVGLHLVYSQFRTLEGIGIFKLVLESNNFSEFKLFKDEKGEWDFSIGDLQQPRFVLYTGTEDQEQKEIIRNIYNSRWENIPVSLAEKLKQIHENNFFGEIIKVFMITSSGAEGIDLKNTRYVHIMEPYWHPVRTSQVIGRANRLKSHIDLPEKYRTVKVFQYIMYISKEDLKLDDAIELVINDIGKLTNVPDISEDNPETKIKQQINRKIKLYETLLSGKKKPLTSDEALYETSAMKEIINESLLKVIKETSIDCNIHNKKNKDIMCYTSYSTTDENAFVGKPSIEDEDTDKYIKKNIVMVDFKGITITLKGVDYVLKITDENRQFIKNKEMNKLSGELYDVDSIRDKQPILVGNLSIKDGKQNITMV